MKPNTYTKLYVHIVFSPLRRENMLKDPARTDIHKYIYGVISGMKCKPVAINGTDDHIHILAGFVPTTNIADMVRDIKRSSALYANKSRLFRHHFSWQEGYGAFTVGHRELDKVYKYIIEQEEHHKRESSKNEYLRLLTEENIDFDNAYIFEYYND